MISDNATVIPIFLIFGNVIFFSSIFFCLAPETKAANVREFTGLGKMSRGELERVMSQLDRIEREENEVRRRLSHITNDHDFNPCKARKSVTILIYINKIYVPQFIHMIY